MSLRIGIAAFALIVAASSSVRADYLSAISAYEIGAYEVAFGEFRPLAQSGDPAAQYHLGLMFRDGRGVQKDPVTALGWFLCAASSAGQVGAGAAGTAGQVGAGAAGTAGKVGADAAGTDDQVGADAARSAERLSSVLDRASVSVAQEKARSCRATAEKHALARSGDPAAQYDLGLMFKDGRGVQKDPVTALGWFICAAGLGGQVGTDTARLAEQLSSVLDPASISAAQEKARSCRATVEALASRGTVEGPGRPGGTSEGSERPGGTGKASERPDSAKPVDWETFKVRLSQFFQRLSLMEVGSLEGNQSFFSAPKRRTVWSRAFFLPADGTLVGSQHVAWEFGARDLYLDLRSIARSDSNIVLGIFAVLWWLLIGKTLLSMGGVLLRAFRRPTLE